MSNVAVPSLRKSTRKSRTVASRAVVSQQTLVAMPVTMIVSIPREQVDMRKQFNGILGLFSDHGGLAQIALLLQSLVARPAIGVKGAAGLHRIRAERVEASGGSIRNRTQPDSAYAFTLHLYRDDYQRLIASTRTAHAILLTAHEGRLDLNPTLQSVASRPHHCAT